MAKETIPVILWCLGSQSLLPRCLGLSPVSPLTKCLNGEKDLASLCFNFLNWKMEEILQLPSRLF